LTFSDGLLLSIQKETFMGRPQSVTDEEILTAARRCFLRDGAGVAATEIARELGITHTTVFNRFGSKEALMIAALGPPEVLPWAAHLAAGPDERPIREQLIEIGVVMSDYFTHLAAGLSVLRAAGITPQRIFRGSGAPPPVQAFRALSGWLKRARARGLIGDVDIAALTATMIGALHNRSFTRRATGLAPGGAGRAWVTRFVTLLWSGIAPRKEK
jgi:AcrR family transcriptional regulator